MAITTEPPRTGLTLAHAGVGGHQKGGNTVCQHVRGSALISVPGDYGILSLGPDNTPQINPQISRTARVDTISKSEWGWFRSRPFGATRQKSTDGFPRRPNDHITRKAGFLFSRYRTPHVNGLLLIKGLRRNNKL